MADTTKYTILMRSNTTHGTDEQEIMVHSGQIAREVGKRIAEGYGATCLAVKPEKIEAPSLVHDAEMLRRFDSKVSTNGKLERRIVANFIHYMMANGFTPVLLDDREEASKVSNVQDTMELAFNLDEFHLYMDYNGSGKPEYWVFFILGEGFDIINDYGYPQIDRDGWKAAMDAFNPEDFA